MARFLNDDIKLRYGGRKGIKMSIDELRIKLWDYMKKIEDVDEAFNGINDDESYALLASRNVDDSLLKDIKYYNDSENYTGVEDEFNVDYIGQHLLGFHTMENGFTFYGAMGGADSALPMFSIFYYDGSRVRAYTPTRGNTVNVDFKCALELEEDCLDNVNVGKIVSKYQKLGIYTPPTNPYNIPVINPYDRSINDETWSEMYIKKYGLNDAFMNFNAIKEEIMARVTVV